METAVCVSGFLLLFFSTGAQLSPDPELLIGAVGGSADLDLGRNGFGQYFVLYRVSAGGDMLLMDCSQPERPQPDGYHIECDIGYPKIQGILHSAWHIVRRHLMSPPWGYITMKNLTVAQSGDYRLELWTDRGLIIMKNETGEYVINGREIETTKSFRLIVCAEGDQPFVEIVPGGRVTLCGMNSALGSSLQLYQYDWSQRKTILLLDTNSSVELLVEGLRGRLQVDLNTLQVTLSGVVEADQYSLFYCTTWSKDQCQNVNYMHLIQPPLAQYVFHNAGENVTLPCFARFKSNMYWFTHTGFGQLTIGQSQQQEVMYMLNGSQTGDYSLIIPSVSLQHSGRYECMFTEYTPSEKFRLFICSKKSPLDVMFSDGESLCLEKMTQNVMRSVHGTDWYRQKFSEPKVLILTDTEFLPWLDDLKGRVNVTADSLILSNLTAEDSGLYSWTVYGQSMNWTLVCSEGSYRLVYLDPFGVHSPFYRAYAPLMGCGLLGLVAAVIWLKLRSRRGEQTSGRQSREGQQSGDEDLHEEVEMAEISG